MSSPTECKHSCVGCNRQKPEPPVMRMINGSPHFSVRPSCHPEAENHPFERGGLSQGQMEQSVSSGSQLSITA